MRQYKNNNLQRLPLARETIIKMHPIIKDEQIASTKHQ